MIIELPPQKIAESPTNPRKRGLLDGIEDLTESIRAKGLLQPVVVRAKGRGHELVFGHRRREAAIRAELATIPCIVREFSDDEVLEVQIMENLEREDVHPLDEAEGFAELVRRGRTVQQIAEKVGRPASFVAQRMKLLDLGKEGKAALDRGSITLAVAMVLARVPAKLQSEALDEIEEAGEWDNVNGGRAMTTAQEALKIVKEKYVLRLSLAKFPTDDATLVKAAGACSTCPKRSGNQAVLFADFEAEDLCMDPACHRKKADAQWARVQKQLPEKYSAVLSDKDTASAINNTWSGTYVRLDGKTNVAGKYDVNVKKALGKELPPLLLGRNQQTGELIEFVKRSDLEKVVKAKQAAKGDTKPSARDDQDEKWKAQRRRDEQKQKATAKAIQLAIGAVVERAPGKTKPEEALRLIVMSFAKRAWNDTQKAVLERRGIDPGESKKHKYGAVEAAIVELAQNLPAADLPGLGLELAINIAKPSHYHSMHKGGRSPDLEEGELDIWGQLLDVAGVDFPALQKQCLDELKAKEKEKADKAKARAQKEAAKTKAAAPPASGPKATTKKKPAKRARKVAA